MEKFAYTLGIIFIGLALGYTIQILVRGKLIRLPYDIEILRKKLQKIALLYFNPIAFLGAVWIVNLENLKVFALPFIGITSLLLGGTLAFLFAKMLGMSRRQTGAYIVSGGFTNIGSIGGLICFTFLGEAGFALGSFYKLFETFSYYAFGFPIAKSYSADVAKVESFRVRTKNTFTDPYVLVALGSLLVGFVLNVSDIKRPDVYASINAIIVPTATILLLSSIGMAMRFSRARKYIKESSLIAIIKFIIVPVTATAVAYYLGFGKIDQGLPLKVVLILSSMPVGFTALVPPTIYDLDVDLANTTWLVTNFLLLLVVPLQQFLITLF